VVVMAEEEALVVVAQEVLAIMATTETAVSPKARIARLVALVAAVVVVPGPCPMWDAVRASTSRRPRTSMLDVVATSMQSGPEETSHASLQRAAC